MAVEISRTRQRLIANLLLVSLENESKHLRGNVRRNRAEFFCTKNTVGAKCRGTYYRVDGASFGKKPGYKPQSKG